MRKIVLIILIVFLTIVPNVSVSKADELTNPVWEKVIANGLYLNQPINNNAQSMALTEDNGIIAISTKRTNSNADIYVVKTERTGEKIWKRG